MAGIMALEVSPFSAYCDVSFQPSVGCLSYPKVFVIREGCHCQYSCYRKAK